MATTITGIMQTKVINTLDTFNHTAGLNSLYTVSIQMSEVPASGITLTIKQGSTTIASASAPAAGQNQISLQATLNCAVNDVIGVVVASSTAIDQQLNTIKGILKITPGLV